jgi:hypothetical protein
VCDSSITSGVQPTYREVASGGHTASYRVRHEGPGVNTLTTGGATGATIARIARTYDVNTQTGSGASDGTDDPIYIRLFGEYTSSWILLDDPNDDDREVGDLDYFPLPGINDLGELQRAQFRMNWGTASPNDYDGWRVVWFDVDENWRADWRDDPDYWLDGVNGEGPNYDSPEFTLNVETRWRF